MNKRGLSIGTLIILVLGISMLILGLVLVKNIFEELPYKIYEPNCKNFTMACNETIEVTEMFWGNDTIKNTDLTIEFLNSECNQLQEGVWACNKYLIM